LETAVGRDGSLKCKLPFIIPGLGSTDVAKNNWEGLAIGAALAGVPLTIGENVCGMDDAAVIEDGRVVSSPDLERRVRLYKEWQLDGYGEIIVQSNVEDTNLGVLEYAIQKLGVVAVELKWGQGAKDIGGEVKISSLEKAQRLYDRGYIVLPNPRDPAVIEAFNAGVFREFRAPQPPRHGERRELCIPRTGTARYGGQVRFPQDRRLPTSGPGARCEVVVQIPDRPSDHRWRWRRHRHEPLAHDERVGHPHM
jgi:hypothetical protein